MSKSATEYPVLVGFWRVDGVEQSNEIRISGKGGHADKASLGADIRAQFPAATEILPLGTKIETRSNRTAFIEATPGMVLRNIFTDAEGKDDPVRKVGEVWFSGAPYEVVLLFSRAQGAVLVKLYPRITAVGAIRFSNQINPQRLLTELPKLLAEVFGNDARDLKLNIRERAVL